MFELDQILKQDTFFIKDLKLCKLLLMNNALYPWLILVPKKPDLTEIIDLSSDDQILLIEEIALISKIVKQLFKAEKLNIAALGNVVKQLHIHIIARYKNDKLFPKPVWSDNARQYYDKVQSDLIIDKVRKNITI